MLPLETVTIFSWKSVVTRTVNQTDIHRRPHKIPPVSSALYHTSVPCGNNLILETGILFLAWTECRFTLRWETRDRLDKTMETLWIPVGPNIHHIASSEVTDRQKTKFPSPGPHAWGYSTVWYCVLRITHTAEAEKFPLCFLFERFRVYPPPPPPKKLSAAILN